MNEEAPTRETTLAVILGASAFPKQPQLTGSEAFFNSARDFKTYLLDANALGLSKSNVLDLFDSTQTAVSLDEKISEWLESRRQELESQNRPPRDIIVYYVGHGGFAESGSEYFLAVRDTRLANAYFSGYAIKMLANTMRESAAHLRKYLIFDSCFSAAAYDSFQSSPLDVAKQKTLEEFPSSGTALFCAAGPKDPAKVLQGQKYTMFSGALLDVLSKGVK